MSFDPSDEYSPDRPPRRDDGPDLPPLPDVSTREAVRNRVRLPAIFLIVIAVLNALGALVGFGFGLTVGRMPADQLEKQMEQQSDRQAKQLKDLKAQGYTVQDILNFYFYGGVGGGTLNILTALLIIGGAVRMLQLKSYGLAVFASVLAAVPGPSCSACCGVGMAVGIWAIVVLVNPDVRAAFR
jgi:hypothetical protein